MSDDCLDARRGKFANERGKHIVAQTDRGECTDRIHDSGGKIGDHAADEHNDESFAAAVMVDLCKEGALGDGTFCRIPEVETHQQKGDGYTNGLGDAGKNNAGDNAEKNDVCR